MILLEPPYTHYSYLTHPRSWNEPTGLYNLSKATVDEVKGLRDRLHNGQNEQTGGELLARVPLDAVVQDMKTLRALLEWVHQHPDRAEPPAEEVPRDN